MKKLMLILFWIALPIAIIMLTIGIYLLIGAIQAKIFLPKSYLLWTFNPPSSRLVIIYEIILISIFLNLFKKRRIGTDKIVVKSSKNSLFNRYKKLFIFTTLNIVLLYTIITSVTVITHHKIIEHSFLSPTGKEYSYTDIVGIDTGVYGKKLYFPFTHSKGDFFYIIELHDGTKIDLTEVGGVVDNEHEYFIIEKLDTQFVNMGIPKVSSMENFIFTTEHLDAMYTDKIQNVLKNNK